MSRAVLRILELGLSASPHAHGELRSILTATGPGRQELRCRALTALACAAGADATTDFALLLGDRTRAVRELGADLLYHVGDDRAWDAVLHWYTGEVDERGPRRGPLGPAMPLSYLLVHAGAGTERAERLVDLLRRQWQRLSAAERQWLATHAPEIAPGVLTPAQVVLPSRADLGLTA
ncbi:hypothetical protein [Kineosporia succinea]|uniref:HEAT repeat protein n=1 Tax=Kineosporia succinea TaxID=84632 RepID=A0ABT9P933_9ACTN|nr:hypothetical protein [Kineosporia succinea]MDP9829213.1 hypothetical protein [Kineosporia succinea]